MQSMWYHYVMGHAVIPINKTHTHTLQTVANSPA